MADIYEHYKGDLYLVIFDEVPNSTNVHTFGRHNTPNREHFPMTFYISLTQARGKPVIHCRETREFHQRVCGKRGCDFWGQPLTRTGPCNTSHPDRIVPRFKRVA
jgi:hypothetical protein